jgi:hypothetical protein
MQKIFTGKPPFPELVQDTKVIMEVWQGSRPSRPSETAAGFTDDLWHLIQSCWKQEASDRPDIGSVLAQVSKSCVFYLC